MWQPSQRGYACIRIPHRNVQRVIKVQFHSCKLCQPLVRPRGPMHGRECWHRTFVHENVSIGALQCVRHPCWPAIFRRITQRSVRWSSRSHFVYYLFVICYVNVAICSYWRQRSRWSSVDCVLSIFRRHRTSTRIQILIIFRWFPISKQFPFWKWTHRGPGAVYHDWNKFRSVRPAHTATIHRWWTARAILMFARVAIECVIINYAFGFARCVWRWGRAVGVSTLRA